MLGLIASTVVQVVWSFAPVRHASILWRNCIVGSGQVNEKVNPLTDLAQSMTTGVVEIESGMDWTRDILYIAEGLYTYETVKAYKEK